MSGVRVSGSVRTCYHGVEVEVEVKVPTYSLACLRL